MSARLRVLCVVPARGGSKSIPLKNLRPLRGFPLVGWPLKAAMNCELVTTVVCSSDHDEILRFAELQGAKTHKRPSYLATDEAASPPVVLEVLDHFEKQGEVYDFVMMLEPTSPLTNSNDIIEAINLLEANAEKFDSLVTVSESVSGHPDFTFTKSPDMSLKSINQDEWKVKRRQEISKLFFIEGTLYLSKVENFKQSVAFVQKRTMGMEVPREKSFEIDDELDFYLVNAVLDYQEAYKNLDSAPALE